MTFKSTVSILAILLSILFFAGCSQIPQKQTAIERADQTKIDLKKIFIDSNVTPEKITLHKAFALALKNNLQHRINQSRVFVAEDAFSLSRYDQLPQFVLGGNRVDRSPQPKVDLDEVETRANLSMVWNVLDFGVSYIKSRQEGNRYLVEEEKRRLATNRILKETNKLFWRSLAGQQVENLLAPLEEKLKTAIENSAISEKTGLQSPIESLEFQKRLLETLSQLHDLQDSIITDRIKLAKILNINPAIDFELVAPQDHRKILNRPKLNLTSLENYALNHRPELYEADYQVRIQSDEVKKSVRRMLPGLEIDFAREYNSGDAFINNAWTEAGLQLTWNIFSLLSGPKTIALEKNKHELEQLKRLSMTLSVITQVQVAFTRWTQQEQKYRLLAQLHDVYARLLEHADKLYAANQISEMELLQYEAEAAVSAVKIDLAYAKLHGANAELKMSLGVTPASSLEIDSMPVDGLEFLLRESDTTWLELHFIENDSSIDIRRSTQSEIDDFGWTILKNSNKKIDKFGWIILKDSGNK